MSDAGIQEKIIIVNDCFRLLRFLPGGLLHDFIRIEVILCCLKLYLSFCWKTSKFFVELIRLEPNVVPDDLIESFDHFLTYFVELCCLLVEEIEVVGLVNKLDFWLLDASLEKLLINVLCQVLSNILAFSLEFDQMVPVFLDQIIKLRLRQM